MATAPQRVRKFGYWAIAVYATIALVCSGCGRSSLPPPPQLLDNIGQLWEQGKTAEGSLKARQGRDWYGPQDCYYWWRFSLYLESGGEPIRQALLNDPLPVYLRGKRAEVKAWWDRGDADPEHKPQLLAHARSLAEALQDDWAIAWTDIRIANTYLNTTPRQYTKAGALLESVIRQARDVRDPELEAKALINLSVARMNLDRHDEAIALCQEALRLLPLDAEDRGHAEVNLGWSWLQLGEDEKAFAHTKAAADLFSKLRQTVKYGRAQNRVLNGYLKALRNLAKYRLRNGELATAAESLHQALEAAKDVDGDIQAEIWEDQAGVAMEGSQYDVAADAVTEAIRLSGFKGAIESQEDAHIVFIESRIREMRRDARGAEAGYSEVFQSKEARGEVRLVAAGFRANLLAAAGHFAEAEVQYREAVGLLESMRESLKFDESKLSFFQVSSNLFDQYVDLLVHAGQKEKALIVADGSRARLLSDYQKDAEWKQLDLASLHQRLRLVNGVALFYWIGGTNAYLWIVDGKTMEFVNLKGSAEIEKRATAYANAVSTKQELTAAERQAGCELRKLVLDPAGSYLTKDRRLFMVLDGALGLINPESLPDCRDNSSWFIEEANVSLAPSLTFLQRPPPARKTSRMLLAIGDADGTPEFPKLANAAFELEAVTGLFPKQFDSFRGRNAQPGAYFEAHPDRYDMIHFTAHGEAKAANPLDSAVILSAEPDSKAFKLYARQVVLTPIAARLVTISACKGASSRTYRGEGVVGLAWAFLRAGAGQVVAGLWNVSDESARHLMPRFYRGIRDGMPPADALRAAKLEVMKGYKSPHDWAVFEMFTGYIEPSGDRTK